MVAENHHPGGSGPPERQSRNRPPGSAV